MADANGSAAAALGGDARICGETFLEAQLSTARVTAAAAARELLLACHDSSPPERLDRIAHRMLLASAELRMAAHALSLSLRNS